MNRLRTILITNCLRFSGFLQFMWQKRKVLEINPSNMQATSGHILGRQWYQTWKTISPKQSHWPGASQKYTIVDRWLLWYLLVPLMCYSSLVLVLEDNIYYWNTLCIGFKFATLVLKLHWFFRIRWILTSGGFTLGMVCYRVTAD